MAHIVFSNQCFFYHMLPIIPEPPKNPMPDPDEDPSWYGETLVRYPSSRTLVSLNNGHGFKARAELGHIMNSLATRLFARQEGLPGTIPPSTDMVLEYLDKLNNWFVSLPHCLTAAEIVFPSQLKIQ